MNNKLAKFFDRKSMTIAIPTMALLLIGSLAIPVSAESEAEKTKEPRTPDAEFRITTKAIALGVGVQWGSGELTYKGETYKFSLKGLNLIDLGISKATASGKVYNLNDVSDFAGTYLAGEAGITIAGGIQGITMRNDRKVIIDIRGSSKGARLTLAPGGLTIKLQK